jgi:hypothetical protein
MPLTWGRLAFAPAVFSPRNGENPMVTLDSVVDIDPNRVLKNIGYADDSRLSLRISSLVKDYVDNACQLIDPAYTYVIKDITSVRKSRVVIEGGITFKSEIVAKLLKKCDKVAVFALTIGKYLEEAVAQLAEDGLVLQASVLDAIGSVAAESVADCMQERIGRLAQMKGLCLTHRMSPGHCDWDVDQQPLVFRALNMETGEIRLTESCLMVPRKSISGIIGIGPCQDVAETNPCKTCDKSNCQWRK